MKIVFFGTPAFVVPVLEALAEHFEVVGIVTKGLALQRMSLPIFTPDKLDQTVAEQLTKLRPDLFIVAAYGKIIPQSILDIPKHGTLNIHYSLLPKYRGASPIQAAILNGDEISGTSIIKMDAKLDHGPIVTAKKIRLSDQDTFQSLNTKMTEETIPLLIRIIPEFAGGKISPVVQDDAIATYCTLVKKEDGFFEIDNPPSPEKLDRMIRAYYPWPAAWTKWDRKIVKFLPGGLVQMEGKRPVKLADFRRGHPNFPLENFPSSATPQPSLPDGKQP